MTEFELHNLLFSEYICGCGDPYSAVRLLRDVLEAIRPDSEPTDHEALDSLLAHSTHPGLYWHYLYFLDYQGLTEHGTTIRGCWLTDKGKELRAALLAVADIDKLIDDQPEEEEVTS